MGKLTNTYAGGTETWPERSRLLLSGNRTGCRLFKKYPMTRKRPHALVTDDLRPLTLNHYADSLTNLIGCFVLLKSESKGIVDHTKTEE
jgi:hypothetical protein